MVSDLKSNIYHISQCHFTFALKHVAFMTNLVRLGLTSYDIACCVTNIILSLDFSSLAAMYTKSIVRCIFYNAATCRTCAYHNSSSTSV